MKKLCLLLLALMSVEGFANTTFGGELSSEWASSGTTNTFGSNSAILNAESKISNKVNTFAEIDFTSGADRSTNGSVLVHEAWVDYAAHNLVTIRTGIVDIPVGSESRNASDRKLIDNSITSAYLAPSNWSESGVGVHGAINLGGSDLDYEAYVTNGLSDADDYSDTVGVAALISTDIDSDTDQQKSFSGRVGYSPIEGANIGAALYMGSSEQAIYSVDAEYAVAGAELKAEYITYSDEADNEGTGYYLEAAYNIGSFIGQSGLDVVVRYDNVETADSVDASTTTTFGLNYSVADNVNYKVNYISYDWDSAWSQEDEALAAGVSLKF